MADKQFARSGTGDFDLLADDDPLSELARIVGYDNRPAVQQLQEIERQQLLVRHDPVFDLEDELSREFDLYDAPAAVAVKPAENAIIEDSAVLAPDKPPVFDEPPAFAEPPLFEAAAFEPAYDADELQQVVEPVYETPVSAQDYQAVVAPFSAPEETEVAYDDDKTAAVSGDEIDRPSIAAVSDNQPSFEREPEAQVNIDHAWASAPEIQQRPQDDDYISMDLDRELELSIGYDEIVAEIDQPTSTVPETNSAWPEPFDARDEPAFEEASFSTAAPFGDDAHHELSVAEEPLASPGYSQEEDAAEHSATVAPAASGTALPLPEANSIDALLADIERFPVPAKSVTKAASVSVNQPETTRKNNYPFTPTFSRATPTASQSGSSSQKAFATPLVTTSAVLAPALEMPVAEPELQVAAPVSAVSASSSVEPEADFDLDSFELDLSDMDLDLDLDPAEFAIETPALPVADAGPVVVQRPVEEAFVQPADLRGSEIEPALDEVEETTDYVLPFDPSMISETEENVTAIADLEVPHLPVVEKEKPVAYQPDYDLDIDAEIAQLFGNSGRESSAKSDESSDDQGFAAVARSIPVTHASAQPSGARANDEFEEFEKAMEEDFRRTMTQRQDQDPVNDRLAVGGDYESVDFDEVDRRSNVRRLGVIAAAVGGLLILGGVGVYAWIGSEGTGLVRSDPKIILADKSPVKMVPVEKGGKTVPNQDKAVYDRVAGAPAEAVQQGALVSSTEQPIDVVQRTLTPESLPLEGAEDFDADAATPIDGDDSARLLPDGDQVQAKANDEDRATAVSPRKVRTMIVKPDGTLVAREEPVAEPATELAANETPVSANDGEPQVKTVKTTVVTPQAQPETAAAAQTDLRTQEQPEAAAQESALSEVASASVDETAPVRTVKTTTVSEQAPVPQTRPAEQPVNVVGTVTDQGNVTTAQAETAQVAAAETTPVQTASVPAGSYVIQIASLPSEAEAKQSYTKLSGKFGSVIGGRGADIRKAEIAGKGTYYRVRIPVGSREEANALCSRYKSAGGSCLVTK